MKIVYALILIGSPFVAIYMGKAVKRWIERLETPRPPRTGTGLTMPSLPWKLFEKLGMWVMVETLALAIICRYWVISGNALLAFAKDWWLIVIPAHILVGLFILRNSHGHSNHSEGHGHGSSPIENIKAVLSVVIMLAVFGMLFQFGGCIGRMNNPDYAIPQVVVPAPQPISSIETGIRLIVAPVTNWSETINIPAGGGKCSFSGPPTGPLWVKLKMGGNERVIRVEASKLEKLDAFASQLSFRSATNYPVEFWAEVSRK